MENIKKIKLQGSALKILKTKAFNVLCEGKIRSGKTFAILAKIHQICSEFEGVRVLISRKERKSLTNTVIQTFEDDILPKGHYLLAGNISRKYRELYQYRNGSTIVVGGLDDPGKWQGSQFDIIYVSEATYVEKSTLDYLAGRLSCHNICLKNSASYKADPDKFKGRDLEDSWQQIIMDCNPSFPFHFLNLEFSGSEEELKQKNRERITVGFDSNPLLFDAEINQLTPYGAKYIQNVKRTMSGVTSKRMLEGVWAAADDLVYSQFNPEKHLIPNPKDDIDRYYTVGAVDFGWSAGAIIVIGRKDGKFYVMYEVLAAKKSLDEWVQIIKEANDRYKVNTWYCDSAEPRSIDFLQRRGVNAEPVVKGPDSVMTGIKIVQQLFAQDKLFIFDDSCKSICPILQDKREPLSLQDELYSYSMDVEKDIPIAKYNHICDTLRYALINSVESDAGIYITGSHDAIKQAILDCGEENFCAAEAFGWVEAN